MTGTSDVDLRFTVAEAEEVLRITAAFTERAKHDLSVDVLIQRWKSFTRDVQQGYGFSLDEYENDLSVRNLIEQLIDGISPEAARKVEARISASDKRFTDATTELDVPLPGHAGGWWWCRLPRKVIGDLKDDLATFGITS